MTKTINHAIPSPGLRNRSTLAVAVSLLCLLPIDQRVWAQGENNIDWQDGPKTVALANLGHMLIPEGYRFTGAEGARRFSELTQNPPDGTEIGVLIPPIRQESNMEDFWFILFKYDAVGYVKDDDKDVLDSATKAAILGSIKQGTEQANVIRRQKGWSPLIVINWQEEPFYDSQSHNLKWAVLCSSGGHQSVNFNTRLLCRSGVVSANMVLDPRFLASSLPAYNSLIGSISFNGESQYGAFREGDKIAEYGLVALIAGSVGTTAIKTGFFAKYLKPILIGLFAAIAAMFKKLKELANRMVARQATSATAPPSNSSSGENKEQSSHYADTKQPPTAEGGPFVIVSCLHCGQKNRIPTSRLTEHPICGRCHNPVIISQSSTG